MVPSSTTTKCQGSEIHNMCWSFSYSFIRYYTGFLFLQAKRISEQEMLQISREIGGSGEDLAAQMGRLTKWHEIKLDSTAANKILNLLFDWDKGGGEREELVQHLKKLQFIQLAEK